MLDREKIAIILFNLGGPDSPKAIRPFLFNLFNDKAIIDIPNPFRWFLAQYISFKRAPIAREMYAHIGGRSPLLEQTEAQGAALETALRDSHVARCFVAMRYWHPRASELIEDIKTFNPDRIVLLPLYPQYSTTTTASSVADWNTAAFNQALEKPTKRICCYPTEPGFISALVDLTKGRLAEVNENQSVRVLFSAHGLPKKIVDGGDPYQNHVERTCQAIVNGLNIDGLDWSICYQSRVGKLEWIGPSTDQEIERAGKDGKAVVVVPVAFVSEHSETLVELDLEYRELAERAGVKQYLRVPTVGTSPSFIDGLARLVRAGLASKFKLSNDGDPCPKECKKCARRAFE